MEYVITPPALPSVPVAGHSEQFPVHRIYCVGRNYAEHAREMGATGREAPFFFSKPADAIAVIQGSHQRLAYPGATAKLHHEVELVVALGSGGTGLTPSQAARTVWGYAVGIDLTRRDLQDEAKEKRRPWDTAKGFDRSAPIGALVRKESVPQISAASIWLDVGAGRRQSGHIADMIWGVDDLLAELSRYYELAAGDLVFTGTPAGVGALDRGDVVRAGIDGVGTIEFTLV